MANVGRYSREARVHKGCRCRRVYLQGIGEVKVDLHRPVQGRVKTIQIKCRARALIERYDLLVVEHLQIANMVRRAKPVPYTDNPERYLANGAQAKSGLSRSISDAGWGRFISILRAKAEEAERIWIEVDPQHSSDRCEKCGHVAPENRVAQAEFRCQARGHMAQADEHAARNLLRAGPAHRAQAA